MPNFVAQMRMAAFILVAVIFPALAIWSSSNLAQSADTKIPIEYVPPKNPGHQSTYEQMKQEQVLEYVQKVLDSLRLPRTLPVKLMGCDGVANAWYDGESVTVCYEYIEEVQKNEPNKPLPLGITKMDTLAGPLLDVFMHESGHAVFDILSIPIWGREEDAADYFSTYVMLQYDKQRARELILGSAYQYTIEMHQPQVSMALKDFSDEHGTPAQRFYNVLCIAYGADPKLFADVVEQGYLPKDRADGCDDEYHQVSYAFKTTVQPHLDRGFAKQLSKMRSKLKTPQ